mgnify:FL=1
MKFTDCIEIVGSKPTLYEGTKQYVSTGAVEEYFINEKSIEEYSYKERPSRADLVGKSGDILFAKMAETKKTLILDKETENYLFSTGFFAIRPKNGILTTKCLYYLLNSKNFLSQKDKNSSGATQKAITNAGLEKINVNIPLFSKQDQIVKQFDLLTDIIKKYQSQLKKLDSLIKSRFIEMFGDIIQNTKNWELKSFTEIAKSRLGKMLDSKKQTGKEKYPYLANFNVQWFRFNLENLNEMDFSEADRIEFALKDDDLLVCEGGEVGRCAVWHNQIENCFFQKAVHRVRLNMDLVHPDYMAYWFKFRSDFNSFDDIVGSKATIAHLTGEKLKLLQIPVPPLSLQNDFASFVQQIDKSKFAVQKALEKAETLYKSLMQLYFA